jgi:hypothetical protein
MHNSIVQCVDVVRDFKQTEAGGVLEMSIPQRIRRYAGMLLVALCILAGVVSFVSMGEVLGDALGTAYGAPITMVDMGD